MVNQLKMARVQDILVLYRQGLSKRRIARTLGLDRETVCRHLRLALETPAPMAEGSADNPSNPAISPSGSEDVVDSKPAISPLGSVGRKSHCEPFREVIEEKLRANLSVRRIYQDLKVESGFKDSYDSVKRFVRRLGQTLPLPFRRMESEPAQEAQVDFGKGAPVKRSGGRTKRPHLFRMVLSFSRKGYSEAVWRQDTETFIRCLENAFWSFGGVPRTLVTDNLKAAVSQADWYDPEIHPKIQDFCRHYGTVLLPTKPRMPRHKGKIEGGIDYCQDNGLKSRQFDDLAGENNHLAYWESNVADTRIHGTTRQQVKTLFEKQERPALLPLPSGHFLFFHEGRRSVHRDGHVEVDKAYYSVPPEYLGHTVWVRYDQTLVRVFNQHMKQIAVHCRAEPGKFRTEPIHIPKEKVSGMERGTEYHLRRTQLIGPWSHLWAKTMLEERGIPGIRVLVGFVALAKRHSDQELEQSCQLALGHGCFHLRSLRHLLTRPQTQPNLAFMDKHPLIRDLSEYQAVVDRMNREDQEEAIILFPAAGEEQETVTIHEWKSVSIFLTGDKNHERKCDDDAQTTEIVGTGLQSGSPSAGSLGKPVDP